MDDHLAFMTDRHRAVRNFVVRELPRLGGKALKLSGLLDDLEKHLFFLVRNSFGDVSWAFPVTSDSAGGADFRRLSGGRW